MRIAHLTIEGFRGFDEFDLAPRGHVALVGEPRAGRSDLIAALERVLHPDSLRWQPREWDFHGGDLGREIRIEATLVDLDAALRQRFLRSLEAWDPSEGTLVDELDDPAELDGDGYEPALRLRYSAVWDPSEERSEQLVEFAKVPPGQPGRANRVSREDRLALPFMSIRQREPLAIRSEGDFRRMLEDVDSEEALSGLRRLAAGVEALSAELSEDPAIVAGLERVLESLREPLALESAAQEVIRFLPEGGAVTGLLRSLTAALDLGEGAGYLPIARHGSTIASLMSAAEALWWANGQNGVVAIDDFGDGLDAAAALRMTQLLASRVGQAWISTRRPEVARAFSVEDLVRLTGTGQSRMPNQCDPPVGKDARGALRHYQLQLLPAMTSRAVLVCEGSHDVQAFRALADRMETIDGSPPPVAHAIELVDGGGKDQMWKVAAFAQQLGFSTVGIMDWDKDNDEAALALERLDEAADAVVRLPLNFGVERLLLSGLTDDDLLTTLKTVAASFSLTFPGDLQDLDRAALDELAMNHVLKKGSGGLHAPFVEALPEGVLPPVAVAALSTAIEAVLGAATGVHQL